MTFIVQESGPFHREQIGESVSDALQRWQPTVERYTQWWAQQCERHCPATCTGLHREVRLRQLIRVEADMAEALAGLADMDHKVAEAQAKADGNFAADAFQQLADFSLNSQKDAALGFLRLAGEWDRLGGEPVRQEAMAWMAVVLDSPQSVPLTTRIRRRLRRLVSR